MLSQWIRQKGFELIDSFMGKPVMSHYKDIEYYWENPEKIADFQQKQFNVLAQFAVNNVEYYKGMKERNALISTTSLPRYQLAKLSP